MAPWMHELVDVAIKLCIDPELALGVISGQLVSQTDSPTLSRICCTAQLHMQIRVGPRLGECSDARSPEM